VSEGGGSGGNQDRRRERRQRTARAAITRFDGPLSPVPCVLLEISKSGARIHVHDSSLVPDSFQLHVETDNTVHVCNVVWRKAEEVGVQFLDAPPGGAVRKRS